MRLTCVLIKHNDDDDDDDDDGGGGGDDGGGDGDGDGDGDDDDGCVVSACVRCKSEAGAAPAKTRFVRGVGTATATEASRATQVGIACQVLRQQASHGLTPASALYEAGPPRLSASAALSTQFPKAL